MSEQSVAVYKRLPDERQAVRWTGDNVSAVKEFVGQREIRRGLDIIISDLHDPGFVTRPR